MLCSGVTRLCVVSSLTSLPDFDGGRKEATNNNNPFDSIDDMPQMSVGLQAFDMSCENL